MKLLFFIFFILSSLHAQKILIPLYSYPNWYDESYQWKNIPASSETYVIINPNNGPETKISKDYIQGIKDLKAKNLNIIGYVYTSYGKRPLSSVKNDISTYASKYKGVKGIFFDETSTDPKKIKYYETLSNYAKSKGLSFIILNPGITTDKIYINSGIADVIVTFEDSENNWLNKFPNTSNYETKRTKLAVLLHDADSISLEKNKDLSKKRGFSYIYFTEDKINPNPWDNLSTYISKH